MSGKIQITQTAASVLGSKKRELQKCLEESQKKQGEVSIFQNYEKELKELNALLDNAEVIEFSESQPAQVVIGARITLENLKTSDTREYTIMTRTTANPLKGVISNESPLAQKVLGLKLGNTFKFRDLGGQEETFKIKAID